MLSSFKKPATTLHMFRSSSMRILLNIDTFELHAAVFTISEASSSKDTCSSGSPMVTCCSVYVHDKVAKKRDASTSLLQRLYAHIVQLDVDIIERLFHSG